MAASNQHHVPVMVEEAMRLLRVTPGGIYVDATAGAGGHATRIAAALGGKGRLIAIDRDPAAVQLASARLSAYGNATVEKANYSALTSVLARQGVARANGVLLDAGVSSMQLAPERGFSLQSDGPLDMRMDTTEEQDAAAWLAGADPGAIQQVLRDYGDVGPAGRIARVIADRCRAGRMRRTSDLAEAVREALDFVAAEPDEIRTVFQAVRIAVNEELRHLEQGLRGAADVLDVEGRLVVISFHSGEDRIVKQVFRELSRPHVELYPDGRVRKKKAPVFKLATAKPLTPSTVEMRENPRSKSAKMRALERIAPSAE